MNKISVAMTTYNGQNFLKEQLASILAQSRQVDELVVCDDGSIDDTVNILKEFADAAPFPVKIVINEKNLGSTKNFEKAISLCSGNITVLCDQDDIWLQHKVKILEEVFVTNPNCGMAFTDAVIMDEKNNYGGKLWAQFYFGRKKQKIIKRGDGLRLLALGNIVTGATSAITKSFFEETVPFPKTFVHDHWLATIAALKGRLFFSDAITVNYRRHSHQQLGTPNAKGLLKRADKITDYDSAVYATNVMRNELDARFHLTEKQRKLFADIIEFYLFRRDVSHSKPARAPKIIKRLLAGNYHKFSSGFLSAAKDLIKKPRGGRRYEK